mmetsp:Transcript_598/g.1595  ORF Transcript_598/g.1595 Transcript_598/m.1595 type:complete len:229 (-) Transcript_598:1326-2012(-)
MSALAPRAVGSGDITCLRSASFAHTLTGTAMYSHWASGPLGGSAGHPALVCMRAQCSGNILVVYHQCFLALHVRPAIGKCRACGTRAQPFRPSSARFPSKTRLRWASPRLAASILAAIVLSNRVVRDVARDAVQCATQMHQMCGIDRDVCPFWHCRLPIALRHLGILGRHIGCRVSVDLGLSVCEQDRVDVGEWVLLLKFWVADSSVTVVYFKPACGSRTSREAVFMH